jgi:acyl-CoA synthetase (AMP-forming)/AMP-acid ligase II
MIRLLVSLLGLASIAATPAPAPPPSSSAYAANSSKLTSVYNLAHVGAMLDVCAASASTPASPKSKEIAELSTRLATLVKAMGGHYRDRDLATIYESTKAQMASDEKLKRHVHETHQDCGESSLAGMRTYVADNEAMIHAAIESASQKSAPKSAQPPK